MFNNNMFNNIMNFQTFIYMHKMTVQPPADVSCYKTWKAVIRLPAAREIGAKVPAPHWLISCNLAFHWLTKLTP